MNENVACPLVFLSHVDSRDTHRLSQRWAEISPERIPCTVVSKTKCIWCLSLIKTTFKKEFGFEAGSSLIGLKQTCSWLHPIKKVECSERCFPRGSPSAHGIWSLQPAQQTMPDLLTLWILQYIFKDNVSFGVQWEGGEEILHRTDFERVWSKISLLRVLFSYVFAHL